MAIGWLSVLKMVPWGDVINHAPKIADGAKKLWSAVAKKSPAVEPPTASVQPTVSAEARSIALLQARLAAAEAQISDLNNQMLESSKLISELADQNTQLIKRFEVNRIRVLWLAVAVLALGLVVAINLTMVLTR
ncbi:MAG TPA: hypothetical protein VEP67_11915 [Thiobacillaceae bacterium]|nr:hypothetical protein [Thiobacillaceae bacterium]